MGLFSRKKTDPAPEQTDGYAALGLSPACAELVKQGDERAAEGDAYGALSLYFTAHMQDKYNLVIARRYARQALSYDDPAYPGAMFRFLTDVYEHHTVEELSGEDFELMAKSLYWQIKNGNEAKLDAELKDFGFTTAGYLAKCISDARYLGVDVPEFKEMEAAVAKGTENVKNSSFFKKR